MTNRDPVVSEWCGQARYGCRLCAFDTLDETQFPNHMATAHPLPPDRPVKPIAPKGKAPATEPEKVTTDG